MNKTVKVLITLGVFTLVVLYFVQACGNNKPVGSVCENFNSLLMQKTEEYFSNNLPQEDGDMKTATINELVAAGFLTLSDLEGVGTTCSGNVYVGKNGDNYYYSNDVTCGTCTTGNLYTTWSDWQDTLPNIINENSQVQVGMFYNYGKGELAYSDWSEWALTLNEIEEPTLPTGVTVVNTEKEEKTQYSYRDGSFKWYKLTGGTEYYGGGKYYETSPASGYSKDTKTKKTIRSVTNPSKTALINSLSGLEYSDITTVVGHREQVPKYKYSKQIVSGCLAYKPLYKCYKTDGYLYTCALETESKTCSYTSEAAAKSACQAAGNSSCEAKGCASSLWTYHYEFKLKNSDGYNFKCVVQGRTSINLTSSCTVSNIKEILILGNDGIQDIDTHYCYDVVLETNKTLYYTTTSSNAIALKTSTTTSTCTGFWNRAESGYTKWDYKGVQYLYNQTACTGLYTTYATTPNKVYYDGGNPYTSCSDKTGYTSAEATGETSKTECLTPSYTTVYLKKDGSYGTLSEADYLSDSQYAALGSLGSGYSKTSYVTYDVGGDYVEGSCPSGTIGTTCDEKTLFKASVYTYKWYKTSSSTKTWYNGGEYSAIQPSGYQPDTSSANWGEWSTFSDTKATSTTTRQVKTQIMKRIRKSYMGSGTLYLENFLPLGEFETKVGKTLAELSQDTSLIIQKKIMYRYRTLNNK